jgi:hypothetical protein
MSAFSASLLGRLSQMTNGSCVGSLVSNVAVLKDCGTFKRWDLMKGQENRLLKKRKTGPTLLSGFLSCHAISPSLSPLCDVIWPRGPSPEAESI